MNEIRMTCNANRLRIGLLVIAGMVGTVLALALIGPVMADSGAPNMPARPTLTSASHDSVTISWTDPSDSSITGYQILRRNRDTDAIGDFTVINDDTGTADTSYTDTTVEASSRYTYRVKARNANGLSEQSGFLNVSTPAAPTLTPSAPARPTLTSVSHDSVTISWADPNDSSITGYQILRRNRDADAVGDFTAIEDDTGTADTSYTDSTVAASSRYTYRVKARNANGLSEQSGFLNVSTPAAPAEPLTRDATAPALASTDPATVDGATLVLTYNEPLDVDSEPPASAYTVEVNNTAVTVSSADVDGMTVTLTLAAAVSQGDTVTITYAVPGSNPVQDAAGNEAAAFSDQAVTNNTGVVDSRAPQFSRATIEGATLKIRYDEALKETPLPATGDFTVTVDGSDVTPSTVSIGGDRVTLELDAASAASRGDTVTLSYTAGVNPVEDAAGNDVADLSAKSVENLTHSADQLTFIANIEQAGMASRVIGTSGGSERRMAQAFTTGPGQGGYSLESVTIQAVEIGSTAGPQVKIAEVTGSLPGADLYTLLSPDSVGNDGEATFTAPADSMLQANTTYFVVVENINTGDFVAAHFSVRVSDTADEDSGGLTGWSIADDGTRWLNGTWQDDEPMKVQLSGIRLPDTTPPALAATDPATVDGATLVLTYDEALNGASDPAVSAYTVEVNDTAVTVSSVDVAGMTVTITLAAAVSQGDTVTITYAVPGSNPVEDSAGNEAAAFTDQAVTVRSNSDPTFDAGTSITLSVNENVATGTTVGTLAVTDADNDSLTLSLTGTDSASFTISAAGQITTAASLNFESKSTYSVTANVRDSKDSAGAADTATDDTIAVTINVNNVEEGGTLSIRGPSMGGSTLTGTLSDLDGSISNRTWQWLRGNTLNGTYTNISGATSASYRTVAADVGKFIRLTARYTDGHGPNKTITATLPTAIRSNNDEPEFDAGAAIAFNVNEGVAIGTNVGTLAVTDDDNDDLTFALTGTDATSFRISTAGQITTAVSLDFETKTTYSMTVAVSDGKDAAGDEEASRTADDTIAVTINVRDVNEAPLLVHAPSRLQSTEATLTTTALNTYSADDPDGDTLTWSVLTSDDGGKFQIDQTGVLRLRQQLDFENPTDVGDTAGNNTYALTVKVADPDGLSATVDVIVTILNSNERPVIDSGPSMVVKDENTPTTEVIATFTASDVDADDNPGNLTWSLRGEDLGDFRLLKNATTNNAELRFGNVPDYEAPADDDDADGNDPDNVYEITVRVIDDDGTWTERDVTVTVRDVNEAPRVAGPARPFLPEIATTNTIIAEYTATDPDAGDTVTWSVESSDDGGKFEISSTGQLTLKAQLDFENPTDVGDTAGNNTYALTVKAADTGGLSDTFDVIVTIFDINEAPVIESGPTSVAKGENRPTTEVIATFVASDEDAGDNPGNLRWSVSEIDHHDFTITRNATTNNAELRFSNVPDYEAPADEDEDNVYEIIVVVRDDDNALGQQPITVTVRDLNETPVISGDNTHDFAEIPFDFINDTLSPQLNLSLGAYTAYDDDGDSVTWAVSGPDAAHFSINSSSGGLRWEIQPDFENPQDVGSNNVYEVTVEADDGQGGTGAEESVGTFSVTITVTNVNETPEIPAGVSDESFAEIEWDATNPDLDIMTYVPRDEETGAADLAAELSWSLTGTDAADFRITENTTTGHGTLSFRDRPNYEDPTDRANASEAGHTADDNDYHVIVRISDGVNTREYDLIVTVNNVNERPEFTRMTGEFLDADEIEYDSGTTAEDMRTIAVTNVNRPYWYQQEARDEEGDNIEWTLSGADAGHFVIEEVSGGDLGRPNSDEGLLVRWNIVPDRENPLGSSTEYGAHGYVVNVNASDGNRTSTHRFVIRIIDVNERPQFTGTIQTTLDLNEHDATLNANFQEQAYTFPTILSYDAHDEEGGVTWRLTGTDAADFAIDTSGNVTFAATPNFESPRDSGGDNVYNFNVVMTDVQSGPNRRTATQAVTVTVVDMEETGVVRVDNLDPGVGDRIRFTLSDPDGVVIPGPADIAWSVSVLESGVWTPIQDTGGSSTRTFTYLVDEDDTGKPLRASVSYYDSRVSPTPGNWKMLTSAQTEPVTADPRPNVPPRFTGGLDQSVDEGAAGRPLPDRLTASDRDGDTLTFGLADGGDSAFFEINASTGQISIVQDLDFEGRLPTGLMTLQVTLSDGKGVDDKGTSDPMDDTEINDDSVDVTDTVLVRLIDREEEGVVTFDATEPEVDDPLQATLTDGDGGVTGASWQWERSRNGRTGWSIIAGATSSSYTPATADEDQYLRAVVTYADRRGGGKRAEGTTGPVPSANRRPLFPASETGQRTIAENSRTGANVGAPVAAVDPEDDALTYTLTGTDAAAFTVTATGQVQVAAGTTLDFETRSSYSFTVEVHDGKDGQGATSTAIDDTQDVTITVENVEEPGTVTLTSETGRIQARVEVTATLEDDDGPVSTSVTWQWARSRSTTTGWSNIAGATDAAFTPQDTDEGGYIRATASYMDGLGQQTKAAAAVSSRVGEAPPVNSDPVFQESATSREMREDRQAGWSVGGPVTATDFNDDELTYTLSGTDAALFHIDTDDGQISVATGATFDFETKRTLRVTVEVSDGKNSLGDPDDSIDDTIAVTITLTDVNEAPEITGGGDNLGFGENLSRAVGTYTAADPEGDTLTWSVSGSTFWISQRGQLWFRLPPDYEDGALHSATITVEDEEGLSDTLFVSVLVGDLEEQGVVTIQPLRGWDGTNFRAELQDDDNVDVGTVQWQWQRSSNRSSWSDISGATSTGATSSSYTAGADDIGQYLQAVATYEDDRGSGKEASAALTGRIGDSANRPAMNNAPEFTETASVARSISSGTTAGQSVSGAIRATDADPGDVLTYSLSGTNADAFDIDATTGQILTKAVLDHNTKDSYSVTVEVHDGFDDSYNPSTLSDATIDVTITITAPRIVAPPPQPTSPRIVAPPPQPTSPRIVAPPPQPTSPGGGGGGGGGAVVEGPPAPSFVEGSSTTRYLPRTARSGDPVENPVVATNPVGSAYAYSLSGSHSPLFTVDQHTGQVRVAEGASLEEGRRYRVRLSATSRYQGGGTVTIHIDLTLVVIEASPRHYDVDRNGTIERSEALRAISDYFAGLIELETTLEVLSLYFAHT